MSWIVEIHEGGALHVLPAEEVLLRNKAACEHGEFVPYMVVAVKKTMDEAREKALEVKRIRRALKRESENENQTGTAAATESGCQEDTGADPAVAGEVGAVDGGVGTNQA